MVLMTVESTNSNARIDDGEIAPTVIARSGTGGATRQLSCWAVDSHPEDSRFKIVGGSANLDGKDCERKCGWATDHSEED